MSFYVSAFEIAGTWTSSLELNVAEALKLQCNGYAPDSSLLGLRAAHPLSQRPEILTTEEVSAQPVDAALLRELT